ncbi:MAG: protein sorting system archaetidylserine synthase [Halobacteriaceae archaeon]
MYPRFVGRVGPADAVTAVNAALGFGAVAMATVDVGIAARLVLLAAIADGADGILAARYGGTPVGEYLDGLADVASFGVAPAAIVFNLVWASPLSVGSRLGLGVGVPALFVVAAVVRLALYTAFDVEADRTIGVQSTLAGTVLAAAVLSGVGYLVIGGATALFTYLMVASIPYPDLLARDALAMGVVQALAVLFPEPFGGLFPRLLLAAALAYLLLAPRFYWR